MDDTCTKDIDVSGNKEELDRAEVGLVPVDSEMGLFTKSEDEKGIISQEPNGHGSTDDNKDVHDDGHAELDQPLTFRGKLKDLLHSHQFHIAIISLVALDCILVVLELILDYEALSQQTCPSPEDTTATVEPEMHRREADIPVSTHAEEEEEESPIVKAAEALHIMSIIILSIFLIELFVKLFALRMDFFKSKLEIFDGIVILISFVLDVVTLVYAEQFAALDLLVILRMWRIIRVVNGVILSVEQKAEAKLAHHKKLKRRALQALTKFEEYSTTLEEHIEAMKGLLEANGVEINEKILKEIPDRPHYDKKLHLDTEHLDDHHHDDNHHDHSHHVTEVHQPDPSGQPPDYQSTKQGDAYASQEASC